MENLPAMLAFNVGWQEVLIVVLLLLGIIVIPLPGKWMRRAPRRPIRWTDQFHAPRIERIHEVAEAFFCSYPKGEYSLEAKERFRLTFRRGRRPADEDDRIVLSFRGDGEDTDDLPVTLRVLFQPRPDSLWITMKHEVTPRRSLGALSRRKLAGRFQREVHDFRAYLRENFGEARPAALPDQRPAKQIRRRPRDD